MTPVVFEGCFGWLHPAQGNQGIVLCNPFGYDAMCTHKGWRALAERLADKGVWALRFDYRGTGDSIGDEDDPDLFEAWIDSIRAAVAHLRAVSGVTSVALCGLRLGGTLAILAAQRLGDIDDLILLAPALSGKNYLRELRVHNQTWLNTPAAMDAERLPDNGDFVEAFGSRIYRDSAGRLNDFDMLRDSARPARRVLILDSLDPARVTALARHYARHDVDVSTQSFDEYDKFMQGVITSQIPQHAFTTLLDWLVPVAQPALTLLHGPTDPAEPVLHCGSAVETPVVFDDGRLFGVFCRPSNGVRESGPAVLIVNTGAHHHVGDGRMAVNLARRLARRGIASLRMDLGGLGDSVPAAETIGLNRVYSQAACRDAGRGVDWLVGTGREQVVMFGVCAGAYVSLHAAVRHQNVVGCVAVNLQKFIWTDIVEDYTRRTIDSTRVVLQAMRKLEKWKRLMRGKSQGRAIVRALAQRMFKAACARLAHVAEKIAGLRSSSSAVRDMIRELDRRGVQTRFVFGTFDMGLDELKIYFGTRGRQLRRTACVRAVTIDRVDHALFSHRAREQVMTYFESYLQDSFGTASDAGEARVQASSPIEPACAPESRSGLSEPASGFTQKRYANLVGPMSGDCGVRME